MGKEQVKVQRVRFCSTAIGAVLGRYMMSGYSVGVTQKKAEASSDASTSLSVDDTKKFLIHLERSIERKVRIVRSRQYKLSGPRLDTIWDCGS